MPRATTQDPTGPNPGRIITAAAVPLDPKTVVAVAERAGFRGNALATAVAVSFAENGAHNATAQHLNTDKSVDTGLWQINSVHTQWTIRQLFEPQVNANAAYQISSQGRDFGPWVTYSRRLYLAQLPAAHAAIADLQAHGGAVRWLQNNPIGTNPDVPGNVASPNLPTQVGRTLSGPLGEIQRFISKYVLRAFEMLGGLILIFVGIFLIAKDLGFTPPMPSAIPVPV